MNIHFHMKTKIQNGAQKIGKPIAVWPIFIRNWQNITNNRSGMQWRLIPMQARNLFTSILITMAWFPFSLSHIMLYLWLVFLIFLFCENWNIEKRINRIEIFNHMQKIRSRFGVFNAQSERDRTKRGWVIKKWKKGGWMGRGRGRGELNE